MRWGKIVSICIAAWLGFEGLAQAGPCPLPSQKPMRIVQLFFGRSLPDGSTIPLRAWQRFLRTVVTPRFPDGLTVYDAYGQWSNPQTHRIVREPSAVVLLSVASDADVRGRLDDIVGLYRKQFRQQSVGVITTNGCGEF